ncbi:MAG: beta-lactamase family protein [Acidobacteriota bacterium]|nr:beta-lactamase family protein [Acidobacteriota bacterium]
MRLCSALVAAFLFASALSAADLSGVWEAKRRFGPDARGAIILQREGTAWRGDFLGRQFPVQEQNGVLTFTLPEGSFRGRIGHDGFWTQERKTTDGNAFTTPVRFTRESPTQWRGEVVPLDETFTFYLVLQRTEDGAYSAFLRNPERNVGVFLNVTRATLDGTNVKLYRKENVLTTGTYDADRDVLTIDFSNRGGTYDFTRAAASSAFHARPASHYSYRPPLQRNDGWRVDTLENAKIDRAAIEKFVQMLIDTPIDSVHAPDVHALLIARHGKLVLEEYFHGHSREALHEMRSATKSVTSLLFGAAGLSPSTPVYESLGAATGDERKRALRAEHLLTMSSGFYCDDSDDKAPGNENTLQEQENEKDWYRFTLNLPMSEAPGAKAVYCSVNANLLGAMIARATHEPLAESFDRLIARPLQFDRYALNIQPTGEAYMAGGMQLTARDFLKIGQVMLSGGKWHGRTIVSADYARRATSPLTHIGNSGYGYLWWNDRKSFYADGNGGQTVIVVPELDLVIAFFGGNYADRTGSIARREWVPEFVLPAVGRN